MLQLLFSLLLSQWFPKYDIITQRLSEGLVTHDALNATRVWLVKKKKNIPSKILCRGVDSWIVTVVYFCHIHQQDVNHWAQNKHTEDQTSHSEQDSTVTEFRNDCGWEWQLFFLLRWMDVRLALRQWGQLHSIRQALPGTEFPSGYDRGLSSD